VPWQLAQVAASERAGSVPCAPAAPDAMASALIAAAAAADRWLVRIDRLLFQYRSMRI
jgi:hypothetical protein